MKMFRLSENGSVWVKKALASGALLAALLMSGVLSAAPPAHASTTFTVNNTIDPGDGKCEPNGNCTLRDAIVAANNTPNVGGPDLIRFNIRDSFDAGVKTIQLTSGLVITDPVVIDGYTQTGSSPNVLARGTNAKLMIELDGSIVRAAASSALLEVNASNTVVRGLVINRFEGEGIQISGTKEVRVEGNYIGTDPSGTQDLGNDNGVSILFNTSNNTVGGSVPQARNLISGNQNGGVAIAGGLANKVQGNLIGTNANGTGALGNSDDGVEISSSSNNLVGGAGAAEANTIAFNGDDGVVVFFDDSVGNRILRNSMFSNVDGIDLAPENVAEGPTPNDPEDADKGANGLQNKPTIASAVTSTGTTTIKGKLSTKPNKTFVVRLYLNPKGTDESKKYVGQKKVTTDGSGKASFSFSLARKVRPGKVITATATGLEGTSEISTPHKVTSS